MASPRSVGNAPAHYHQRQTQPIHTHTLLSLYSLCAIPVPPLVICTSPRFIVSTLPMLSLWANSPDTIYEKISNSR